MNRFDFTPYRRNTVGFDRLFELLENNGRVAQNEIIRRSISSALAKTIIRSPLRLPVSKPTRSRSPHSRIMLIVAGKKDADSNDNRDFLHMGIASRNFERKFQLADHIHVTDADLGRRSADHHAGA